jgi:hypothetical protein
MARVNYQRDKRLKDLDRQRKQEEKRAKKLKRDLAPEEGEPQVQAEGLEDGQEAPPVQE